MYSIQRALFVVVIVLMCDRSFSDRYIMYMRRRQELFFRPYFSVHVRRSITCLHVPVRDITST